MKRGENLPRSIDGNDVTWTRIDASEGAIFSLISTADMERDLHEVGLHITDQNETANELGQPRSPAGAVSMLAGLATQRCA